jgi:hypothetical protein
MITTCFSTLARDLIGRGVVVVSTLSVPYLDTRAAALGWSLDVAEQPAVARLDVPLPAATGLTLHLRVLGASHQVLLRALDGTTLLTETVACRPRPLRPLPPVAKALLGPLRYTLRSEVLDRSGAGFGDDVDALLASHGPDPAALVGRFPGNRHAVTVVRADPVPAPGTLAGWQTWHTYPGRPVGRPGQIVRTTSTVRTGEKGGAGCAG